MEIKLGNPEELKEQPKHTLTMLKLAQNPKEPIAQIRMVTTDGTLVILKPAEATSLFSKNYIKVEKGCDVKVKFFHSKDGKEVKMNIHCELYESDVFIPIGNVIDITQIEPGVARDGMVDILENFQAEINNPKGREEPSKIAVPDKKIILPGR